MHELVTVKIVLIIYCLVKEKYMYISVSFIILLRIFNFLFGFYIFKMKIINYD